MAVELAGGDDTDDLVDAVACEGVTNSIALLDADLIFRFLATFGPLLPADDVDTIDRWRAVRHRLWKVVTVSSGRTAELVDLVGGQVRTVLDDGHRCCVIPGQVLYGAMVPAGRGWFMPQHLPIHALDAERIAGRIRRADDPMSIAVDVYRMFDEPPSA